MSSEPTRFYAYEPSKVLPIVFSVLLGVSWVWHIYQNTHYRFWRVTFWMNYAGLAFTAGWILRSIFAHNPANKDLYIAQTILILAGPPMYSAAEYNILARIMHYLPMHAPIGPNRVLFFFTYLGILVESLTAAGASRMAGAQTRNNKSAIELGTLLVSIAVILQAGVQLVFASTVGLMHYRTVKANMLTSKLRTMFIMLYGTSLFVIWRCIYRAIEKFSIHNVIKTSVCEGPCRNVLLKEWYLYAFEAAPMVIYTFWINIIHPGRFLPREKNHFLDYQRNERVGPIQKRKQIRWMSLLDMGLTSKGDKPKDRYWERPEEWPLAAGGGEYAKRTESNVEDGPVAELQPLHAERRG